MRCELCGKNNATVFGKIFINDELVEAYICQDCAKNDVVQDELSLFFDDYSERICVCGTNFSDIKQSGFVGCPMCYQTFSQELTPLISSLHGAVVNQGKKPLTKIEKLERQIDEAVANKFYELAVKLNDELKKLKGEVDAKF